MHGNLNWDVKGSLGSHSHEDDVQTASETNACGKEDKKKESRETSTLCKRSSRRQHHLEGGDPRRKVESGRRKEKKCRTEFPAAGRRLSGGCSFIRRVEKKVGKGRGCPGRTKRCPQAARGCAAQSRTPFSKKEKGGRKNERPWKEGFCGEAALRKLRRGTIARSYSK